MRLMFKSTQITPTTEKVIEMATSTLAGDINGLSAQRECALSAFRQTATDLDNINSGLRQKLGNLEALTAFINEQSELANQMIGDNDKVRTRILDIIGE